MTASCISNIYKSGFPGRYEIHSLSLLKDKRKVGSKMLLGSPVWVPHRRSPWGPPELTGVAKQDSTGPLDRTLFYHIPTFSAIIIKMWLVCEEKVRLPDICAG